MGTSGPLPHHPAPLGTWGTSEAVPTLGPRVSFPITPCPWGQWGQEELCPCGALCPLLHRPAPSGTWEIKGGSAHVGPHVAFAITLCTWGCLGTRGALPMWGPRVPFATPPWGYGGQKVLCLRGDPSPSFCGGPWGTHRDRRVLKPPLQGGSGVRDEHSPDPIQC